MHVRRSLWDVVDAATQRAGNLTVNQVLAVAWVESRGNPGAIGDDGHSLGVWQLHDEGAGSGMTDAERVDLLTSTRVAIGWLSELVNETGTFRSAVSAYNQGLAGWRKRGGSFNKVYVDRVRCMVKQLDGDGVTVETQLAGWMI